MENVQGRRYNFRAILAYAQALHAIRHVKLDGLKKQAMFTMARICFCSIINIGYINIGYFQGQAEPLALPSIDLPNQSLRLRDSLSPFSGFTY